MSAHHVTSFLLLCVVGYVGCEPRGLHRPAGEQNTHPSGSTQVPSSELPTPPQSTTPPSSPPPSTTPPPVTPPPVVIPPPTTTALFHESTNSPYHVGEQPSAIAVGRFGISGRQGVAVANFTSSTVTVLGHTSNGILEEIQGSPYAVPDGPNTIAVADIDGDGVDDIVITSAKQNSVSVLLQDAATRSFIRPSMTYPTYGTPASLVVADIDHKMRNDIAVMSTDSAITLLTNDGFTLALTKKSPYFIRGVEPCMTSGDVNGDHFVDLFMMNAQILATSSVSEAKTLGSESTMMRIPPPFLLIPGKPCAFILPHLNADEYLDAVVATQEPHALVIICVFQHYSILTSIALLSRPNSIAVGDANSDGAIDILVTMRDVGSVVVFLQDAQGSFQQDGDSPYAMGDHPSSIICADVTGDHRDDMIVANDTSNTITIFEQQ